MIKESCYYCCSLPCSTSVYCSNCCLSRHFNIAGLRPGPQEMLLASRKSPGKVVEFLVAERERERESCSWLYKGCEFALNKRGDAEDDAVSGAHRLLLAADRLRVVSVGFSTQPLLIRPLSLSLPLGLQEAPPTQRDGGFQTGTGRSTQTEWVIRPKCCFSVAESVPFHAGCVHGATE